MEIVALRSSSSAIASKELLPSPAPSSTLALKKEGLPPSSRIDFSRITPRQLQEYLDEMIFSEQIDPMDATALGNALPAGLFFEQPDTPIDLRSKIEGMIEFDRNNGFDLLATFHASLLDRMRLMEDRSMHISVTA
ncbi:hypothetical protein [Luteibacter sp.]|jgi:hypothetical protein|uniref:hypothetical protein n=1 Tax=Luteibacter sp. TaxID=1886636 RepID=UPI002F41637B